MRKTCRRSPLWNPLLVLRNVAEGHVSQKSMWHMLWGRGDLASMRWVFLRNSWGVGPSVGQEIPPPPAFMEPKIHFPADTSLALDPFLSHFTPLFPVT
jgi:hypothetical protein